MAAIATGGPMLTETAGDQVASFEEVYRASHAPMARLAYVLMGSRAVGDELVHDAFARLYERFDEIDNPGGFLRVALIRLCSTARSRRHMEADRLARLPEAPELAIPELDETWAALARLRPERRLVVALRFYEDLSHAEIADLLGCPVATVRTRLHRGLADLRKEMER
jgi:RNA polymerase sigma factor (sigma-70 family)